MSALNVDLTSVRAVALAAQQRYAVVPLLFAGRYGIEDRLDAGRVIIRDINSRCAAEVVASLLNDLHDDNAFLREALANQGVLLDGAPPALPAGRG